MPDSTGTYLGDRSGVLPQNTAALLHFSDQFAQMTAQRRAEKAAQRQIKAIPKSKVTIKPTIIQRATNAVKTVVKKVKGTDKKLY